MLGITQAHVYRRRQRGNRVLFVVFCLLLVWVGVLFYQDNQQRHSVMNRLTAIDTVTIQRQQDTIKLQKKAGQWWVQQPYENLASTAVVETLLSKLQLSCRQLSDKNLGETLTFFASLQANEQHYQIGELNTAADEVYVKYQGQSEVLYLCDKLIASIALAPSLNFIDKQLYQGELSNIKGSFGQITDFSGIDLSVLQIAVANEAQIRTAAVSDLTFNSQQGAFQYQVLPPTADSPYLLLFEPQKKLIYAIAANRKLLAILGL